MFARIITSSNYTKLINALLQFSYIESNQLKAHYREINIAKFTQELASEFKSMAKTL
ncbi:hypothetical protein C2G38_2101140, partial [Gigaspora rosea]